MFTKLVLDNFKSFNKIIFDMTEKINKARNLIAIYGENGSGKSSLIEAFGILRMSLETVNYSNEVNKFNALVEQEESKVLESKLGLSEYIKMSQFSKLKRLIDDTKTIKTKGNLKFEYSFLLNESDRGIYTLIFDSSSVLIQEKLDYTINQRIGNIFTIEKDESDVIITHLNRKTFLSLDVRKEIEVRNKKLWGNHSFLAIFNAMNKELNSKYLKENINRRFIDVLNFFLGISVSTEKYSTVSKASCLLSEFVSGTINETDIQKIDKTEELLYKFFSSLYVDIKDVFYKKDIDDGKIKYRLHVKKNIYGNIVDVPFNLESKGTKKLLEILPFLLGVVEGNVCFIDEIDDGIHDILMNHLVDNLAADIAGQLVFTTHDTLMLKELSPQSVYFITIDYDGNKKIQNIKDYDNKKLSQNNSFHNQYLKGAFEGVPIPMDIDFEEINQIVHGKVYE